MSEVQPSEQDEVPVPEQQDAGHALDWDLVDGDEGVFYFNTLTGESRWDLSPV